MSDYSSPTYNPPAAHGSTEADQSSVTDSAASAKDKATDAAQAGKQAAGEVAQTATDAAKDVAQQTASHAKDLASKTRDEVTEQAGVQKSALVDQLRSLADQLTGMTDNAQEDGIAVEFAGKTRDQARSAADWLDGREPGDVLDELRSLGRERPAAYLAGAFAAGILAGRLTRGVVAVHSDDSNTSATVTSDRSQNEGNETLSEFASRPSALDTPSGSAGRYRDSSPPQSGLYSDSAISSRPTPGTPR